METTFLSSLISGQDGLLPSGAAEGVVEIGLLLPARRAADLAKLARERGESIGQVLRKLIDGELSRSS
jgi:hypothetical protein